MNPNTKTTSITAVKVALFIVALAAIGIFGLSPQTLNELWQVFDGPVATQPAE